MTSLGCSPCWVGRVVFGMLLAREVSIPWFERMGGPFLLCRQPPIASSPVRHSPQGTERIRVANPSRQEFTP